MRPFRVLFGVFLAAAASGCVAYRDYWDPAADRYAEAVSEAAPSPTGKTVRYTVNVARYVGGVPAEPVSTEHDGLKKLARQAIVDMGTFARENVRAPRRRPDYHFIFDVRIEITKEPGLFSGLILPFYRACEYTARLQVLDEKGQPFANYVGSAETFQVRHTVLLPLSPFYLPCWAERRARRNVFEAIAVKLIADRKEFL